MFRDKVCINCIMKIPLLKHHHPGYFLKNETMRLHKKFENFNENKKNTENKKEIKQDFLYRKPIKPLVLRRDHNIDKILTNVIKTKRKTCTLGLRKK